jgi:hypothetical protein
MRCAWIAIVAGCSGCVTVNSPLFPCQPAPIVLDAPSGDAPRPLPSMPAPIPLETPGVIVPRLTPPAPEKAPTSGRGGGRIRRLYTGL